MGSACGNRDANENFALHRKDTLPNSASQSRVAFSSIASNTGCNSPGERIMTFSTSLVAVCCSSASERSSVLAQLVQQPRVLDGDDRLGREVLHQLDLLVGKWPHLLAVDIEAADQLIVL